MLTVQQRQPNRTQPATTLQHNREKQRYIDASAPFYRGSVLVTVMAKSFRRWPENGNRLINLLKFFSCL